jgi:hypothetical protein
VKKRLTFWKVVAIGGVVIAVGAMGACYLGSPHHGDHGDAADLGWGLGMLIITGVALAVAFVAALISRAVDDP